MTQTELVDAFPSVARNLPARPGTSLPSGLESEGDSASETWRTGEGGDYFFELPTQVGLSATMIPPASTLSRILLQRRQLLVSTLWWPVTSTDWNTDGKHDPCLGFFHIFFSSTVLKRSALVGIWDSGLQNTSLRIIPPFLVVTLFSIQYVADCGTHYTYYLSPTYTLYSPSLSRAGQRQSWIGFAVTGSASHDSCP